MSTSQARPTFAGCLLLVLAVNCRPFNDTLTAKPGDEVTLQCQGPTDLAITLLRWTRPDLKSDEYVFFFRDGLSNQNYQLRRFRGRVELKDRDMKNGIVSVTLKNVTVNDSGTYECAVSTSSGRNSEDNTPKLTSIIKLKVEDSGHTAGGNLILYLSVALIAVIGGGVFFLLWKRQRRLKKNSEEPAADEAVELEILSPPEPLHELLPPRGGGVCVSIDPGSCAASSM